MGSAPGRVVVVGAGLGGLRVVESLRSLGYAGHLTLVGDEAWQPYDRPPLSKKLLDGQRISPVFLRGAEGCDAWNELRLGRRARALDTDQRLVVLDDGEQVPFDAAVIATGAQPREVRDARGEVIGRPLRTIDDAVLLRDAFLRHRRVTVIGGGFIGCEVAASARAHGLDVTIVEALPAPLYRVLGQPMSARIAAIHTAEGVDIRTGATVTGLDDSGQRLILADGTRITAGAVVAGVGVRPAVEWLAGSGVEVGDGILCDSGGRTSVPGVYAVGDAAAWSYPSAQRHVRVEHWTTTAEQAVAVATNIVAAGQAGLALDPVHYFWSDQYGLKLQCCGTPGRDDAVEVLPMAADPRRTLAVYGRDGQVSAVVAVGAVRAMLALRPLIEKRERFAAAVDLAAELAGQRRATGSPPG
jgi:3-phenylpropionate/trans-cinnamate dioxygenase ferredoxin reductase component